MDEADLLSKGGHFRALKVKLGLHLCGPRQLDVQASSHFTKLILNDSENVSTRHRRSCWSRGSGRPARAGLADSTAFSARRGRTDRFPRSCHSHQRTPIERRTTADAATNHSNYGRVNG